MNRFKNLAEYLQTVNSTRVSVMLSQSEIEDINYAVNKQVEVGTIKTEYCESCPICGTAYGELVPNYCIRCGQKLKERANQ